MHVVCLRFFLEHCQRFIILCSKLAQAWSVCQMRACGPSSTRYSAPFFFPNSKHWMGYTLQACTTLRPATQFQGHAVHAAPPAATRLRTLTPPCSSRGSVAALMTDALGRLPKLRLPRPVAAPAGSLLLLLGWRRAPASVWGRGLRALGRDVHLQVWEWVIHKLVRWW